MRVGLAGFGNVGQTLARMLSEGVIPEVKLTAVSAANLSAAETRAAPLTPMPLVVPAEELPQHADVIVECATGEAFPTIARAAPERRKDTIACQCCSARDKSRHPRPRRDQRRHDARCHWRASRPRLHARRQRIRHPYG